MNLARFKTKLVVITVIASVLNYFTEIHRYLEFILAVVPEYNYGLNITNASTVLFYNIYTSPDADLASSFNIINEQLGVRNNSKHPNLPLYYLTFGKDIGDIPCENCQHLDHNTTGDEVWTLSILHQFCQKNPNKNVAYFHNKGSFHPSTQNDDLRRMHNKAVFSEECLFLKNPANEKKISTCNCNICSARFSPLPHYHTSGNMWVAKCEYISKLAAPNKFSKMMNDVASSAPSEKFGNPLLLEMSLVGRDRFASEHWVHSHPEVCPCDVYSGPFNWGYEHLPANSDWTIELSQAPRFPSFDHYLSAVLGVYRPDQREGSWFQLSGRLYEWESLYDAVPGNDSWVWNYYEKHPHFGKIK